MYDKYLEMKKDKDYVLCMVKVGNFYHTYDEDAVIMFYLFKYIINDNKVGFPVGSLSRVVNKLKSLQINYYISEELMEFENNNYFQMLEKSKTYHLLMRDVDDIYNYLVSNIERKHIKRIINKIKEVIDEG